MSLKTLASIAPLLGLYSKLPSLGQKLHSVLTEFVSSCIAHCSHTGRQSSVYYAIYRALFPLACTFIHPHIFASLLSMTLTGARTPMIDVPPQAIVSSSGQNIISQMSKKQAVVSRSSTEAEYRSMAPVVAELQWIRTLLSELHLPLPLLNVPIVYCDNQSMVLITQILYSVNAQNTSNLICILLEKRSLKVLLSFIIFPQKSKPLMFLQRLCLAPDFLI